MKIFLIWLGLVCCSVANGIFYGLPLEMVCVVSLMAISCVAAIYLLYLHRRETIGWIPHPDPWSGSRFPIFGMTLFFSLFALVMLWIIPESHPSAMAGLITIAVTSFIAYMREKDYVEEI